jgi:hypothetical protein
MSFLSPSRPFLRSAHWARLAAVGALLALVGALTIVVATVAEDLDDMLMALACVFVLAFSGWYVLTRRGPMRLLGVPGALLGPRDNLGELAKQAVTDGADVIGMAGGRASLIRQSKGSMERREFWERFRANRELAVSADSRR